MDLNNNAYSKNLGLIKEPFQSTNVYKEELFSKYFIVINYDDDIYDDSIMYLLLMIVIGIKGVRKTAHKNMSESKNSAIDSILTISYTDHNLSNIDSIGEINQDYHFKFQYWLLLVSDLAHIIATDSFTLSYMFDFTSRQKLYRLCKKTLNTMLFLFFKQSFTISKLLYFKVFERLRLCGLSFDSFLSITLKHVVFWLALIKSITKLKRVEVYLPAKTKENKTDVNNKVISTHILVGYELIYVLIDKVDGNDLIGGNNPKTLSIIIESSLTTSEIEKFIKKCLVYSKCNVRGLLNKWLYCSVLMNVGNNTGTLANREINSYVGYAFNVIRMAKYICPNLNVNLFFKKKMALF